MGVEPSSLGPPSPPAPSQDGHETLRYHLLGPSLTKSGQDGVDQKQVARIIYEASKGSRFFKNEEVKDKNLTRKIGRILERKAELDKLDLSQDTRAADRYIEALELTRDLTQSICVVDCDAFYAAVEEIDHPEYKTLPMAVGTGVITTCNYTARKFGVRSAMAGFVARRLCPELIQLKHNFPSYVAKAQEVRQILADYDPRFEAGSLDEAYLNITAYCAEHEIEPEAAVQQMRARVQQECRITISAGLAPNARLAKIGSNQNKPNGQYRIPSTRDAAMSFMRALPTRKVNGIGRVFERELLAMGICTCGDIYPLRGYLAQLFGEKACAFLLEVYLGLGRTDVCPSEEHERKSVGTESTFADMSHPEELRAKLRHTAEELEADLARTAFRGRTLCLKVKLHTYEVMTRQVAPPRAIAAAEDLFRYAEPMLAKLEEEFRPLRLRLMGLRCTHLVSTEKDEKDFFRGSGRRGVKRRADGQTVGRAEDEFERLAEQEAEQEAQDLELSGQELEERQALEQGIEEEDPQRWHGKMRLPNPKREKLPARREGEAEESFWDCPVCTMPQEAADRAFNDHVDLCLSRQAIVSAVRESTASRLKEEPPDLVRGHSSMFAAGGGGKGSKTGVRKRKTGETALAGSVKGKGQLRFKVA